MKIFQFWIIGIFLIISISTLAQDDARSIVSGMVVSQNKVPLENVSVSIEGTHYGALSDKDGKFRFTAPVGQYTLVASSLYHKLYKSEVNLKKAENTFDIILSEKAHELTEVVVETGINKFSNKESEYIAKLPLKNLENPQVYSVIGKDLMKEQIIVNFDDALKNSPGIDKLWSSTGRAGDGAAYFSLRGFATQPSMVNGLGGQTNGGLDPANVEQIEVIKGPSGTLFGSSLVSYGGLINIVTKKPFETFAGDISYTMGSYGLNRIAADINTPLDKQKKLLLRTNTAYQYENSFQDAGFRKSLFFAPSVSYKVNDRLSFTVNTEFYTSESTNTLMVFLNRTRPLEYRTPEQLGMNYKRSFTSNDITVKNPTVKINGNMEYKISDKWLSQTSVSYSNRESKGLYSYVMFQEPVKDDSLNRYVGDVNSRETTMDIQQNFIGDFKIANMRNRLVVGVDYFNNKSNGGTYYIKFDKVSSTGADKNYTNLTAANVYAKMAGGNPTKTLKNANTYSAYFSDVLNVTDQLLLMGSLRFDFFDNEGSYSVNKDETTGDYTQKALSPKFGAVYQIIPQKLSVFANYMNGFKNVASPAPDNPVKTFKPEHANQIEGGFKASLFDGKLVGTVSYYDIYVSNVVRSDPKEPRFSIQDGDISSRGFELDVTVNPIAGLSLIAGYSHNESENKKTSELIEGRRPTSAGPKDLVNGWISYTIQQGTLKGLGFGFGGNYASENAITNSKPTGKFILPSYTILNATAFYNTGVFSFGLKVDNLANKEYWKGWSTVEPMKLRQVIGNVAFHF